jgi:hypothetical protein
MGGGRGSLFTAPIYPSIAGGETPVQGKNVEDTAAMRAMLEADGTICYSSEGSRGRAGDFLWLPFVRVGTKRPVSSVPRSEASETVEAEAARGLDVGDVGVTTVVRDASLASSPVVS